MMPFSPNNQVGSSVFPETSSSGYSSERLGTSIWSNTPNSQVPRPQVHNPAAERHSGWGAYPGNPGQIPEYQPTWNYSQQHAVHVTDAHSAWTSAEHDSWKYSRAQAPPPPPSGGVWQYPSPHQEYHDWSSRAQHTGQQQGYYYVSSGHHHDQRAAGDDFIPYDIGSRRAYQMPPPPPGYPLPPHMQYYSPGAAPIQVPAPQFPSSHELPPSIPPTGSPASTGKTGGAASFLFEAAAAAMAKGGTEEKRNAIKEESSQAADRKTAAEVKIEQDEAPDRDSTSPERVGKGRQGKVNSAPRGKGVTQRVNNHQLRLHGSGNEKAPLANVASSGQVTTLMIRNIPNRYTQTELMSELKEAGFDNKFDFFYLPMDHETHANFGYAFINFVDEHDVEPFTKRFNGLKLNRFTSNKIIQIVPAQLQGFQANLQHYCKKAVCTDDNIDYRPLFFVDGKCLEFHRAAEFSDAPVSVGSPKASTEDHQRRKPAAGKGFFPRKPRAD